jgi:hypothetical protein
VAAAIFWGKLGLDFNNDERYYLTDDSKLQMQ